MVPTISIYEVFRRLLWEPGGEDDALRVVAAMQRGRLVDLGAELALDAARTAHELRLLMADAVILATARASGGRCGRRMRTSRASRVSATSYVRRASLAHDGRTDRDGQEEALTATAPYINREMGAEGDSDLETEVLIGEVVGPDDPIGGAGLVLAR